MYSEINKSGCAERKGLVRIRFDFFLEPKDHNYSKTYAEVTIFPEEGYPGEVDGLGDPVDEKEYKDWRKNLPTIRQNNPFCCHFMYFEPEVTDEEILKSGQDSLKMAYGNWKKESLHLNINPIAFHSDNDEKIEKCKNRLKSILSVEFPKVKVMQDGY